MSVFSCSPATGALTLAQSIQNGTNGISGLADISDIAVSVDDQLVFVAGGADDTVIVFGRDPGDGTLTFRQRLHNLSAGVTDLVDPTSLLVSPDGRYLYASTLGTGAVLPSVVRFHFLPTLPEEIGTYQATFASESRSLTVQSGDGNDSVTIRDVAIPVIVRTLDGADRAIIANTDPLTLTVSFGAETTRSNYAVWAIILSSRFRRRPERILSTSCTLLPTPRSHLMAAKTPIRSVSSGRNS